jgi:FKBP-type peptidyl-prolyl cis-trans isomerase SlyD
MSKVIGIEYLLIDANTKKELDSNVGKAPLEFVSGKGQIIPGLESKLVEMTLNEKADVLVQPVDAYGEYNDEAVQVLPKEQFAGIELTAGMTLFGTGEHGETVQVIVKEFNDSEVTIDYNHPMAGKTLMFSVMITSLRDATADEIESGVVGGYASGGCCGGGHHDHGHGSCGSEEKSHNHGHSHGGCGCSH